MRKISFVVLSVALILLSKSAHACSYIIEKTKKIDELQKVALANLSDKKNLSVQNYSFSYFESKPTPMCPEELTYEASYHVVYNDNPSKCFADIKVKKVESWIDDLSVYTVTGANSARCLR